RAASTLKRVGKPGGIKDDAVSRNPYFFINLLSIKTHRTSLFK
ncbi:hypothetical protein ALQ74_00560, partial [Pseudomonas savastanoi pv. glycinea]